MCDATRLRVSSSILIIIVVVHFTVGECTCKLGLNPHLNPINPRNVTRNVWVFICFSVDGTSGGIDGNVVCGESLYSQAGV